MKSLKNKNHKNEDENVFFVKIIKKWAVITSAKMVFKSYNKFISLVNYDVASYVKKQGKSK